MIVIQRSSSGSAEDYLGNIDRMSWSELYDILDYVLDRSPDVGDAYEGESPFADEVVEVIYDCGDCCLVPQGNITWYELYRDLWVLIRGDSDRAYGDGASSLWFNFVRIRS